MKVYAVLWDGDLPEETAKTQHEQEVEGQEVRWEEWAGPHGEEP